MNALNIMISSIVNAPINAYGSESGFSVKMSIYIVHQFNKLGCTQVPSDVYHVSLVQAIS